MTLLRYTLHVPDYIINTGLSRPGHSDNMVIRGSDGLPMIPGTSVAGLFRAALRDLARLSGAASENHELWACHGAFVQDEPGSTLCGVNARLNAEPCLLCRLCGQVGGGQGALAFEDAVLPEAARQCLDNPDDQELRQAIRSAMSADRTHNQHDPHLRRGLEDHVYTTESLRPLGDRFVGRVNLWADAVPLTPRQVQLAVMALRAIKELGAKRRRGHGECTFEITDPVNWRELVEAGLTGCCPEPNYGTPANEPTPIIASDDATMIRLTVTLNGARRNLALAARQDAGNLTTSQDYISGRRVWGALASRYFAHGGGAAAHELFFSGTTRFGSCYPVQLPADPGAPTAPMPLSALTCRTHPGFGGAADPHGHGVFDSLLCRPPGECLRCGSPLERHQGYWVLESTPQRAVRPDKHRVTRTAVDDRGRAAQGQLFTTEEVSREQRFRGQVVLSRRVWEELQETTDIRPDVEFQAIIGAGTPADITLQETSDCEWDTYLGSFGSRWDTPPEEDVFFLTLMSDTILLDRLGEPLLALTAEWLAAQLGDGIELELRNAVQDVCAVDGWHGRWRLPMARDWALMAGSAYAFDWRAEQPDNISPALRRLEETGIGVRRAEGFGQVLINSPFHRPVHAEEGHA